MAPNDVHPPRDRLSPGSVIEQKRGRRGFLIVQETAAKKSTIETWDDLFDVSNRLLGRVNATLLDINADLATFNKKLTRDLRKTASKIATNQRLLDELVAGDS